MGFIRPATPGFIVTLTAAILLAVVSFCVPWIKSVYFLKAGLAVEGINGNITFGTLGYCLQLPNGTSCSSPSIGYQLDINKIVGDNTRVQIPQVVVKWVTYALVLHIVALVLAAGSALFGLLAHIREFSMSCMSTCLSGFGAAVTLAAFIFDLAFFFLAKARINDVAGGFAQIGNAVWLTLAAWLLLLFSGCFYCLGRCCISRRPRDALPKHQNRTGSFGGNFGNNNYEDQMRLDAVKAEADRKARAKRGEVGLPAFMEYDPSQPLTKQNDDDDGNYTPHHPGYAQAAPGTRAVDDYYNQGANAYPPQPRRQPTATSSHSQVPSTVYVDPSAIVPLHGSPAPQHLQSASPPPNNAYLATGLAHARGTPSQYSGHEQNPSDSSGYAHSQAPSNIAYGQAVTHDFPTSPTSYSGSYHNPYGAYAPQQPQLPAQPNAFSADLYNNTAQLYPGHGQSDPYYSSPTHAQAPSDNQYYSSPAADPAHSPPQRHYTLGGGGYGDNVVPALHDTSPSTGGFPGASSPPPPPMGPRGPRIPTEQPLYDDSPPVYDDGFSSTPNVYGAKGGHR